MGAVVEPVRRVDGSRGEVMLPEVAAAFDGNAVVEASIERSWHRSSKVRAFHEMTERKSPAMIENQNGSKLNASSQQSGSCANTERRRFLKGVAVAGAAVVAQSLPGCSVREKSGITTTFDAPVYKPGSQKVRVAFIGTGGMGGAHVEQTKDLGVTCPCYCDVDTNEWSKAKELYSDARGYQDYREMFEKEHANFDAVMIGIPDHHHFPATMLALQYGKHVYTQKPLTHTPWEARQLTSAVARYKVATQMGNQGHAGEGWRLVYEWINGKYLGHITEVHSWTNRPHVYWTQGQPRPEGEDPVPANLNWDVWLGPAPTRPYKAGAYHRFHWRGWWDFGCGALGDMACHTMDGLFWALNPGYPRAVEPVAMTPFNGDSFPVSTVIKWEFAGRPGRPPFVAYWYDGGLKPTLPRDLEFGRSLPETGNLFMGTRASLLVSGDYGDSPRVFPEKKMKEIGKPKRMLERSPGHIQEWLMACRGEKPIDYPKSNFSYAGPMTETILLGNLAIRMGRRLEWDGPNLRVTNVLEANRYVTKEYRAGWKTWSDGNLV